MPTITDSMTYSNIEIHGAELHDRIARVEATVDGERLVLIRLRRGFSFGDVEVYRLEDGHELFDHSACTFEAFGTVEAAFAHSN